MDFRDLKTADLRLAILQILEQDSGYSLNEHLLTKCLHDLAFKVGADKILTEAAWLDDQGFVILKQTDPRTITITSRGVEVAQGHTGAPGVARPRPGV